MFSGKNYRSFSVKENTENEIPGHDSVTVPDINIL